MKRFTKFAVVAALTTMMSACRFSSEIPVRQADNTFQTQSVSCVGIIDDKQPGIKYETSVRNLVVGTLTGGVPVIFTILVDLKCPVADTSSAKPVKVDTVKSAR